MPEVRPEKWRCKQPGNFGWRTRSFPALLALLFCWTFLLAGCQFNQQPVASRADFSDAAEVQANALYQEAWQMVFQEYVDPSFNGQDWYRWKDRYDGLLKTPEDAYVAIETMLASLNDDYTRFLRPRDMKEQNISIDSKLYGIGVQISKKDGKLVVVTTFEDTPADKADLQPKDLITHINGNETAGLTVEQCADRIRGKEGTTVTLTIKRGEEIHTKDIVRGEIKIKTVFTRDLDNSQIGYLRLSTFISETAVNEMREIAWKLKDKKAIILDLRGNYGGLLSNAVDIADMFLDDGEIVSMVDNQKDRKAYEARPGELLDQPMVVLIDGGSASASEIVSGALKDHERATLIGTQTFGKGLVQKINHLQDGSGLNITISKYFTPDGTDINQKGIEPDVMVSFKPQDIVNGHDPQLEKAVEYLESKYQIAATAAPQAED